MLKTVRRYRDAVVYLASRMFFVDGMNAVLIFAGRLRHRGDEVGPAGDAGLRHHAVSILAVVGGFVGALARRRARAEERAAHPDRHDRRQPDRHAGHGAGPHPLPLALRRRRPTRRCGTGRCSAPCPDWSSCCIGFTNAIFITGQYASSRTLLTRLTPPEQTGAFFGVYALSGVATAVARADPGEPRHPADPHPAGRLRQHHPAADRRPVGLMFVKGGGRDPSPRRRPSW